MERYSGATVDLTSYSLGKASLTAVGALFLTFHLYNIAP